MTHINETVLYVNLKTLEENFMSLKSKLSKDNKIVAVIKAYAYGLGDIEIAKKLEDLGVDAFWVRDGKIDEAQTNFRSTQMVSIL